jgi:hypothetical protein
MQKVLKAARIESDNLIQSGHGLTGAMQLLQAASEKTGVPLAKMIQREEALRALMPLLSTAAQVYADDLKEMGNDAGATEASFQQMSTSSAMLKDKAVQSFTAAKTVIGDAVIESDIYKGTLEAIIGLFNGLSGVSGDARGNMVKDASEIELAWRNVGNTVRDVFSRIDSVGKMIDTGEKQWNDQNGYQRLISSIKIQQKASAETNHPANSDEFGYYASMKNAGQAINAHTEDLKNNSAYQKNNTASILGAHHATKGMSEAARSEGKEIEDAVNWYARMNEQLPGLIKLQEDEAEATFALSKLLRIGVIDAGTYEESLRAANLTMAQETASAWQDVISEGTDYIYKQFGLDNPGQPSEWADTAKMLQDAADKWSGISDGLSMASAVLGGRIGGGINTIGSGIGKLGVDTSDMTESQKFASQVSAYSTIAAGVGQLIGGNIGSAISSTANMSASGATIATAIGVSGPIGAAVGGVIGLVSSLFGGDNGKAQRESTRQSLYDSIVQSALSGGTESMKILRAGGYTYSGVESESDPYKGTGDRLLGDRGEGGLNQLKQYLNLLDKAGQTIKGFSTPSFVRSLEQADVTLKYTSEQIGYYSDAAAQATEAYWATVIDTVTGVNADNLVTMVTSAIGGSEFVTAGQSFVDAFVSSVGSAAKKVFISQTIEDVVMPTLQPVLQSISGALINGGALDSASMSTMVLQAKTAAEGLTPVINTLATAFDAAGLMATDTATQIETAISTATNSVETALTRMQSAIDSEKARIKEVYDTQTGPLQEIKGLLSSAISSINSFSSLETRMSAQSQLAVILQVARTSGVFPTAERLSPILDELGKASGQYFSSAVDYQRDYYRTAAMISDLGSLTNDQLSTAEQQLQAQLNQLDATYSTARAQYDALLGIDNSVLTVSDAVNRMDAKLLALAGAMGVDMPVHGYATGGAHDGGWRIVGETGWEIEHTGPSRIISNSESKKMLDNSLVVAELARLRTEAQTAQYTMTKLLDRMSRILERWESDRLQEMV